MPLSLSLSLSLSLHSSYLFFPFYPFCSPYGNKGRVFFFLLGEGITTKIKTKTTQVVETGPRSRVVIVMIKKSTVATMAPAKQNYKTRSVK